MTVRLGRLGSMEDRILLAEARGWTPQTNEPNGEPVWLSPDGEDPCYLFELPDPFTDANEDYAMLEWMRPDDAQNSKPIMGPEHERWRDFIFELRLLQLKRGKESDAIYEAYELGDNARAAVIVIKQED